jgi:cytochrome c-type biogenesis protein CcmH
LCAGSALLFALLLSSSAFAIDPMPFNDRTEEVRFQELLRELRCLQCQNQTLADSDADIAKQLREEIFKLMRGGKSNDEIKDYLIARYGEFVLYRPRVESSTWLLWFGPFAILMSGALVLLLTMRKRRGKNATPAPAGAPSDEEDW